MKYIFNNWVKGMAIMIALTFFFSCNTGKSKTDKNNETEQPIMIFAAASLTNVLTEIVDSFEVKYKVKIQTNLASSGTLARQIEQGGIPDIYLSASKKWADYVDSLGVIQKGYKTNIAKNNLVLIAPLNSELVVPAIDSSFNMLSVIGSERLSMGDPTHVPAGKYAKQSLTYYGWYNQLKDKLLPAKDVRSALMVVELGETPLGIVYRTDAQKSKRVKILNTFPECSHKPIVYVGGVCKNNKNAIAFFNYLNSDLTKAIWSKYGFEK